MSRTQLSQAECTLDAVGMHQVCVLDGMGHSEHGSRRLAVALRLLTGPAELLTPLLQGLDAAELMRLPAPEAGYEVEYMHS